MCNQCTGGLRYAFELVDLLSTVGHTHVCESVRVQHVVPEPDAKLGIVWIVPSVIIYRQVHLPFEGFCCIVRRKVPTEIVLPPPKEILTEPVVVPDAQGIAVNYCTGNGSYESSQSVSRREEINRKPYQVPSSSLSGRGPDHCSTASRDLNRT